MLLQESQNLLILIIMMNQYIKYMVAFACASLISSQTLAQIDLDTLSTEPQAQEDTVIAFYSEIVSLAKYTGESVILRWSPDRAGGWHVGNQLGYVIERTEIGADSTYNPQDFKEMLEQPLKPWPLDDWAKIAGDGKNKHAAIAAQSLYGEGYKSAGIFDNADEFQNRYSFALLSADFSPETAEALGLRWVDKDVSKDKTYIYRIFLAKPYENYTVDTAYQVVNTSVVDELPEVTPFDVVEDEQKITFYWNRSLYERYYSAYYIERSADGKNYERLNADPYINALSPDFKGNRDLIIYTDSVPKNYKPYYYRFIGLNAFGELSATKKPITAMGRDRTPPGPPTAINAKPLSSTSVKIIWQKETEEKDMLGYIVSRSQDFEGTFVPLFSKPLKPGKREYIDESAVEYGTNYYMVSALDTAGNISNSLISYAMMIDSIPPAQPIGLTGTVDTTGLVTLSWKLGPERNIKGYNVFFSNSKDHTFTTVNDHPIQDTIYYDTIQVRTLTEEIFYTINAVDVNFSRSEFSDTLRLERPDMIAPTSVVFADFTIDKEGITLNWINSSSTDVVEYILLRANEDQAFQEISRFSVAEETTTFKDLDVESNKVYTYSMITVDDAGLKSELAAPMQLKMRNKETLELVNELSVAKNTEEKYIALNWEYSNDNVFKYVIYRAVDGKNFMTYKHIEPSEKQCKDYMIKQGAKYEYTVKVKFADGRESGFGKIVAMEF